MGTKKSTPGVTLELRQAVETYLVARAYQETVRPIVDDYRRKVLEDHDFYYEDRGYGRQPTGKIVDPDDAWLMADEEHRVYCRLLDEAKVVAGFDNLEPGYCPLLVAERATIDAGWDVVNAAYYITGVNKGNFNFAKIAQFDELVSTIVSYVLAKLPEISSKNLLDEFLNL